MIALQILAGLLLLPLLVLTLLIFNLYVVHFIYFLFIAFFALIFSALFGLMCGDFHVGLAVFLLFIILYSMRFWYLVHRAVHGNNYPAIHGRIRTRPICFKLIFPLNFLKIVKYIPSFIAREIKKNIQLNIEIKELVDLVLVSCRGARLDIQTKEAAICFEIQ